jgi:hypothetical protein
MSAINVVLKKSSVHIICDAASYDERGNLIAAVPKVALLPHLNAAIACRGPRISVPLFADLLPAIATTYDELKTEAPTFLRDLQPMLQASFAHCSLGTEFDVVVAGISETAGPDAYLICSHTRYGGVQPWTTVQLAELTTLPGDLDIRARFIDRVPHDIEAFDPERDGLTVLEAQRAAPIEHAGDKSFVGVGGFAQVTSITRDGIVTKVIHRWPDEIGHQIGSTDLLAAAAMLRPAA